MRDTRLVARSGSRLVPKMRWRRPRLLGQVRSRCRERSAHQGHAAADSDRAAHRRPAEGLRSVGSCDREHKARYSRQARHDDEQGEARRASGTAERMTNRPSHDSRQSVRQRLKVRPPRRDKPAASQQSRSSEIERRATEACDCCPADHDPGNDFHSAGHVSNLPPTEGLIRLSYGPGRFCGICGTRRSSVCKSLDVNDNAPRSRWRRFVDWWTSFGEEDDGSHWFQNGCCLFSVVRWVLPITALTVLAARRSARRNRVFA
jgi:hypothetical protein